MVWRARQGVFFCRLSLLFEARRGLMFLCCQWAHASSSTTSTFATSFRRTLPSGPQAAPSRALLLVWHSGHVLLVRLPAGGASGTAAAATLEVLQATLERPSVVRRGEEEEVKPAPTTDREMVREVSICALPGGELAQQSRGRRIDQLGDEGCQSG
jgi:hypothetical protein